MSAFWITVDVLAASILLRYVTPQLDDNTITTADNPASKAAVLMAERQMRNAPEDWTGK